MPLVTLHDAALYITKLRKAEQHAELCGAWIEYRDLGKVLAHEGPLPHPENVVIVGLPYAECFPHALCCDP
jgi:hypothetical protein